MVGVRFIHPVCEATQNSEKFESNTQVLPSVYRTAGPIPLQPVRLYNVYTRNV